MKGKERKGKFPKPQPIQQTIYTVISKQPVPAELIIICLIGLSLPLQAAQGLLYILIYKTGGDSKGDWTLLKVNGKF